MAIKLYKIMLLLDFIYMSAGQLYIHITYHVERKVPKYR